MIKKLILIVMLLLTGYAYAGCGYKATNAKTVVLFINGINNTESQACASLNKFIGTMSSSGVDSWSSYDWMMFHNQNSGFGNDISELSQQAFWSDYSLGGASSGQSLQQYYLNLGGLYNNNIYSQPSQLEYYIVTKQLYELILNIVEVKNKNIVLVAHSQGNFYAESVYALMKYKNKSSVINRVRVVGVGVVAATSPNDRYISSEVDNALTAQQLQTHTNADGGLNLKKYNVLPRTDNPCTGDGQFKKCGEYANLNTSDKWLGHGFTEVYLNSSVYSEVRNKAYPSIIAGMVQDSINELTSSQPATPPSVSIVASTLSPKVGDVVTFTANASTTNGDKSIKLYSWSFGDGETSLGNNTNVITHKFTTPGNFAVFVNVEDNVGAQTKSENLFVQPTAQASTDVLHLADSFDGAALDTGKWNAISGAGGIQYSGSLVTFGGGSSATTQTKATFSGSKIVLSGRFAGTGQNRDTHMDLVDVTNGDLLSIGDTNYRGYGFYLYGSGASFNGVGSSTAVMLTTGNTVSTFMDYRLTIDGKVATIERSASLADPAQPIETRSVTMPQSIAGRTFYLRIGTGALVGGYSPGTFDSISISVNP